MAMVAIFNAVLMTITRGPRAKSTKYIDDIVNKTVYEQQTSSIFVQG